MCCAMRTRSDALERLAKDKAAGGGELRQVIRRRGKTVLGQRVFRRQLLTTLPGLAALLPGGKRRRRRRQ